MSTATRPQFMHRGMAYLGDKTSHGGVVLSSFANSTWNGIPQVRLGDTVFCPKCKPHIHTVTKGSGFNVHGVNCALDGDLTSCGASLIAESAASQDMASAVAFMEGRGFDEQFRLADAQGQPMANTWFTAKLSDGRVIHGETDEQGFTPRIFSASAQKVEIHIGHREDWS